MRKVLEKELLEVGYFLSRMGIDTPPVVLNVTSWKEAYLKFYSSFGKEKTEEEFKNSLKNIRDRFDRHLDNGREGWKGSDAENKLSLSNQEVFDELEKLNDEELWRRVRPYAAMSYDLKLVRRKRKEISSGKIKFFSSEFSGKKKTGARNATKATVFHGLVVDRLKEWVDQSVPGGLTFNTQKIDLALEINEALQRIYEVKTSADTQSVYTAVGQLYMHSAGDADIEKWIVLPGPAENSELLSCLKTLNISVLWYRLEETGLCHFQSA